MKGFFLLTAKPTLFACNVSEEELSDPDSNPWVAKVRDYVSHHHGTTSVVVSAEIESELVTLPPEERAEYLESLGRKTLRHGYVDQRGVSSAWTADLSDHR